MSLCDQPLLYLFLETSDLAAQRRTLEVDLGLRVVGVDDAPGVRHGVVTYDGGGLLVSLNLASRRRAGSEGFDGLVTVIDGPHGPRMMTDQDGHRYLLNRASCPSPSVVELRLATGDLPVSTAFYSEVLGLTPVFHDTDRVGFAAGAVTLILEQVPDFRRHDMYLLVFYTRAIHLACEALTTRGLVFRGRKVGTREFGSIIHFDDPSGHRFCLFEPSAEALATEVGRKLQQLLVGCDARLPIGLR